MFCSSCGKIIDDDAIFCPECGSKIKTLPQNSGFSYKENVSPEKSIDIPVAENETSGNAEDYSQPEFSPESNEAIPAVTQKDNKPFFGSTEPIDHITPEPVPEDTVKVSEKHTRESLPDLVLRKKTETLPEDLPEKNCQPDDCNKIPEPYNDNSDTQYIPYEEIQENLNRNYDAGPEYEDTPPYNPPEYPENQPYFNPPPPPPAPFPEYQPVKVGTLRLFGAGIVTFITMIFVIILSLLFCIKLGFSGTVIEKGIRKLDTEKILEAEYDSSHDVNEFLYEKTDFYNISLHTANENDFRNFVLNLDMIDFIGENASVYANYLLNSGKKPSVSSEDIAEYMFNKSGYNNLNRQDFSRMVYNLTDGYADDLLSVDAWKRYTGFDFGILSYIFSFITLAILLAVVIIMFIWIAVIVDRQGRHLTGFYKNIFMTSGIILLITGAVCVIAPPIVYSQTSHIAFYLSSKLLTDFNLFILATGGFEVIAGIILGLIRTLIIRYERKHGNG